MGVLFVYHICLVLRRPKEGFGSPGTGVIAGLCRHNVIVPCVKITLYFSNAAFSDPMSGGNLDVAL